MEDEGLTAKMMLRFMLSVNISCWYALAPRKMGELLTYSGAERPVEEGLDVRYDASLEDIRKLLSRGRSSSAIVSATPPSGVLRPSREADESDDVAMVVLVPNDAGDEARAIERRRCVWVSEKAEAFLSEVCRRRIEVEEGVSSFGRLFRRSAGTHSSCRRPTTTPRLIRAVCSLAFGTGQAVSAMNAADNGRVQS